MTKPSYVLKSLASDNPNDALFECMDDVKTVVSEALGQYHPMDIPIICAGLKLLAAALEQHPAVGPAGLELEARILSRFHLVNISGVKDLEERP